MAAIRAVLNQDLSYDGTAIEGFMNQHKLEVQVEELDATNYDSVGEEIIAGVQDWTCNVTALWSSALDDAIGPDALAAPSPKKTLVSITGESIPSNDTSYTWTTNAFIDEYTITATAAGLVTADIVFGLNGNPVRA